MEPSPAYEKIMTTIHEKIYLSKVGRLLIPSFFLHMTLTSLYQVVIEYLEEGTSCLI